MYERCAAHYGWTPQQVDDTDFWLVSRDLDAAHQKRRAQERLDAITDRVMAEGASGKRIEYDERGVKRPEPKGKANTVELVDFARHLAMLEEQAGITRPKAAKVKPTRAELLKRLRETMGEPDAV